MRALLPPFVADLARRYRLGGGRSYSSYAAAVAACGGEYEDEQTVRVVLAKTRHYRDTELARRPLIVDEVAQRNYLIFARAAGSELNVLDFGGACGLHYFYARAWFGPEFPLRWRVVETPRMAAAASALVDGSLSFHASLAEAASTLPRLDLVFSSSVLQCLPDPCRTLRELAALGGQHLAVTRVGLTRAARPRYTVQTASYSGTGPGPLPPGMAEGQVRYPLTFAPRDEVRRILEERYQLELEFVERPRAHVVGREWIDMYGYLGRRR